MPSPLHVVRNDHLRFLVRSQVEEEVWYMVDMGDRQFPKGRCECTDYNVRIEYPMKHYRVPIRYTCCHIDAVTARVHQAFQFCQANDLPLSLDSIPTQP